MKDNKIIAEFMGGIISSVPNLINLPQTRGDANIHSVKGSEMLPNGTYSVHRLNELKYHTSWDWLIPVVNKCYQEYAKNAFFLQHNKHLQESIRIGKIYEVYQVLVEFIKQYNNKK